MKKFILFSCVAFIFLFFLSKELYGQSETKPTKKSETKKSEAVITNANDYVQCLGDQRSLVISSQMPYTIVRIQGRYGFFVLDFGSDGSKISPKTFMGDIKPTPISGTNKFERFDFFGEWGTVALNQEDHSGITGIVSQAGLLGTDFLSLNIFTIDYKNSLLYRTGKLGFCSDKTLENAGFLAVSTKDYYSNNNSSLTCPNAGVEPSKCANVPAIPIRIGSVNAVAQLDTAYDDSRHYHSMNINVAFFQQLRSAGISLQPIPESSQKISTCKTGVVEEITGYRLPVGTKLEFIDTKGNSVRVENDVTIFTKKTPEAAKECGGISFWKSAAAQLGASFFSNEDALIVDPFTARVWFKLRH